MSSKRFSDRCGGLMELVELGDETYACLQPDKGLGWSNSGLVNCGGGLVIDTFWDLPRTREMIGHYQRVWSSPAQRVANTHHNGDHCWGNQLFTGAEIIGHRLCAEAFGKESPELMQQIRNSGSADPALAGFAAALQEYDFSGIELTPPTTLIEDRMDLMLDDTPVELIYVGPAHTIGDVIVHLPKQRVVFAGDVLFRLCTPIGWEGTFANWTAALDRIEALDPEVVVPGHGPLCGTEGPREMKAYLEYVFAESKECFAAELSEIEAAKRIDLGPYASWNEPERLIFNVGRAYRELRGGAIDTPVDVVAMVAGMAELKRHWSA